MATQLKRLWLQYREMAWEKKVLASAGLLALIPVAASCLLSREPAAPSGPHAPHSDVDTYIPKGFVLVPIEVQNYEALDSILGRFGLVDLFQGGTPDNPQQRLVARNVRILRAPQNPAHFAILVQEREVAGVLKGGGLFTVTVKPPDRAGTEFVKGQSHRSIVYEDRSEK